VFLFVFLVLPVRYVMTLQRTLLSRSIVVVHHVPERRSFEEVTGGFGSSVSKFVSLIPFIVKQGACEAAKKKKI
jgi:hypothetical protein